MVRLGTAVSDAMPQGCEDSASVSYDDSIHEDVLAAVRPRDGDAVWVPIHGENLANIFAVLPQRPGMTLVKVGEPITNGEEPVYVARGWYDGSLVPGYCGLHTRGAVISVCGRQATVQRYQVLIEKPGQYQWKSVEINAVGDPKLVVCGGTSYQVGGEEVAHACLARWRNIAGNWVCGTVGEGIGESTIAEILVKAYTSTDIAVPSSPRPELESSISAVVGRYWTGNHWSRVRQGDRYSSACHFDPPCKTVPKIMVGLSALDLGADAHGAAIRVESKPQNITKEGFICNAWTWGDTKLYNAAVDWAAVDEPEWQCGAFETTELGRPWEEAESVFDHRVTFPNPFAAPPMVSVFFNGFDMWGNWNLRTYATAIDHTGFDLSVVKTGDDGPLVTKLWSASITWVAIPGEQVLKRKAVWMGRYGIGRDGAWAGHVDFGFEFEHPPKIFLGLDHFDLSNKKGLRLFTETENVTTTGMGWKIWKQDDTMLRGASVSFIALDCGAQ